MGPQEGITGCALQCFSEPRPIMAHRRADSVTQFTGEARVELLDLFHTLTELVSGSPCLL
ncbi:hypothetical protein CKJ56_13230 [Mycobacterium intracellulare subsp. chimaera]|nr:hypothetical protein CKJ58_26260 [Mycobacterium intracellulare subsp. chimaera]PBA61312.1 hypothetical protein CKJ56_13230 [Mycobacterium intracellulare subsp. chimaera]